MYRVSSIEYQLDTRYTMHSLSPPQRLLGGGEVDRGKKRCAWDDGKKKKKKKKKKKPLLIYTAQGSPFRCKKLSVINGSPEHNNVLKL